MTGQGQATPSASRTDGSGHSGTITEQLAAWLEGDGDTTLGGLIEVFREKSFAVIFVLLLGVPALPIPTGGATHVFEVIAVLVAGQLVAGRNHVWVPRRWARLQLTGGKRQRFIDALLKAVRWLERFSRPRLAVLFNHQFSNSVFGAFVIALSTAAFFAPPFSGLDTLPALGVVLVSLGVMFEDFLIVALGFVVGAGGVVVEVVLGMAAVDGLGKIF